VFLTQYALSNDVQNMLGHLFKVAAYGLVYWGLLVVTVRRPHETLAAQTHDLQTANATLRTQALALETTATPVVVGDAMGNVLWRNRASLAFLPYDTQALQGNLNLFASPMTPDEQLAQSMQLSLGQGKPWTGLVPIQCPSGQDFLMRRVVTPMLDADGSLQGFVAVSEDVTQNVIAQQRYARML
jgi:PAS domain S-box-containing protein